MTKYSTDKDWERDEKAPDPPNAPIEVSRHTLVVNDESDQIDRYNGIQWRFVFEDGQIVACDKSHYCPGPGHTDPMGFRAWGDVPDRVQRAALRALNATDVDDVVDVEATAEVATDSHSWRNEKAIGTCEVCDGRVYEGDPDDDPITHPACEVVE